MVVSVWLLCMGFGIVLLLVGCLGRRLSPRKPPFTACIVIGLLCAGLPLLLIRAYLLFYFMAALLPR